jgi:hypothetical protein
MASATRGCSARRASKPSTRGSPDARTAFPIRPKPGRRPWIGSGARSTRT